MVLPFRPSSADPPGRSMLPSVSRSILPASSLAHPHLQVVSGPGTRLHLAGSDSWKAVTMRYNPLPVDPPKAKQVVRVAPTPDPQTEPQRQEQEEREEEKTAAAEETEASDESKESPPSSPSPESTGPASEATVVPTTAASSTPQPLVEPGLCSEFVPPQEWESSMPRTKFTVEILGYRKRMDPESKEMFIAFKIYIKSGMSESWLVERRVKDFKDCLRDIAEVSHLQEGRMERREGGKEGGIKWKHELSCSLLLHLNPLRSLLLLARLLVWNSPCLNGRSSWRSLDRRRARMTSHNPSNRAWSIC